MPSAPGQVRRRPSRCRSARPASTGASSRGCVALLSGSTMRWLSCDQAGLQGQARQLAARRSAACSLSVRAGTLVGSQAVEGRVRAAVAPRVQPLRAAAQRPAPPRQRAAGFDAAVALRCRRRCGCSVSSASQRAEVGELRPRDVERGEAPFAARRSRPSGRSRPAGSSAPAAPGRRWCSAAGSGRLRTRCPGPSWHRPLVSVQRVADGQPGRREASACSRSAREPSVRTLCAVAGGCGAGRARRSASGRAATASRSVELGRALVAVGVLVGQRRARRA